MASTESPIEKLYTREEAAALLEMSLATFDRLRYAGRIEEIHLAPHKIRFTERALRQYITSATRPPRLLVDRNNAGLAADQQ